MISFFEQLLRAAVPRLFRWVLGLFALVYIISFYSVNYHQDTGFTGIIWFGENNEPHPMPAMRSVPRVIRPWCGFDAERYAALALDPLLRSAEIERSLDQPKYRSRRILMSWIACAAGLGKPVYVVNAFAVLNGVFWLALAALVIFRLRPVSLQEYLCCLVLLFGAGTFESLQYSLTDLPAIVLLLYAMFFPRVWPLCFGAALLTRETSLLSVPAFAVNTDSKKMRIVWRPLALSLLPFAFWVGYTFIRFTQPDVSPEGLAMPLWQMGRRMYYEFFVHPGSQTFLYAVTAVSFTLQSLYFVRYPRFQEQWWRFGVLYVILFLTLGRSVWMGPFWVTRGMLPLSVAFTMLMYRESPRRFILWWPLASLACFLQRGLVG